MSDAEASILEARTLANLVIEHERGKTGGNVDTAIYRASQVYGIDEQALRSFRYRWRYLTFVKAHVLDKLRDIHEAIHEQQRRALAHEIAVADLIEPKSTALENRLEQARALVGEVEE